MITMFLLAASLAVHGDFNHDGHRDLARVVRSRAGYDIVVERAGGRPEILYRGDFNDPYVAINQHRGWFLTACGKGYDVPCRHVPRKIFLRGGELLFGNRESSDFVVIYRAKRATVVQLTD
jgi:hypothetical protein